MKKKFVAIMLTMSMMAALAGCGNSKGEETAAQDTTASEVAVSDTAASETVSEDTDQSATEDLNFTKVQRYENS